MLSMLKHERRRITKFEKTEVLIKTHGRCAYCGQNLCLDTMQVDHVMPIASGGADILSNMFAACAGCNKAKGAYTVDKFREKIHKWLRYMEKDSITYRNARRFGLIEEKPRKIVFYFEDMGNGGQEDVHKRQG